MGNLFGSSPKAFQTTQAFGIDFTSSQYGPPKPVLYGRNKLSGNCVWYGDFKAIQQQQSGGKGGGSVSSGYDYRASFELGLCEGPILDIGNIYLGNTVTNAPALGAFVALGTAGQPAWSHLTGTAALGYSKTALFAIQNYDLGSTSSLPNFNFEIDGLKQFNPGIGINDANPSDILNDICTDPDHGIGFQFLGSLTQYSNYCVANGLFLSPIYDQQNTASQVVDDLMKYTNAACFFSEGVLKIVPYSDVSVTGNGVTFNPVTTPQYNLTNSSFIVPMPDGGQPMPSPVQVTRKPSADAMNIVRVEYKDRSNTYHDSAVAASVDQDVNKTRSRADQSYNYNGIVTAATARFVAQSLLQRIYFVRNGYKFKLPWVYGLLEPMDVVTLTLPNLGLTNWPVRILSVEEADDDSLEIEAEEFPAGIGQAAVYGSQANAGTNLDTNVDPGPVVTPFFFRMPGFVTDEPMMGVGVAGSSANYGGCEVYTSLDNTHFTYQCTFTRQTRFGFLVLPAWPANTAMAMGQLIQNAAGNTFQVTGLTLDNKTGGAVPAWVNTVGLTTTDNHVTWTCIALGLVTLPNTADPDTTNAPTVSLYNGLTLGGGVQADADNLRTLCMVDTELLSYETATAITGGLELTYLRRGAYSSAIATHGNNAPFVRLDNNVLQLPLDPSLVGTTIYFKFLAFNIFGRTPRSLSSETSYSYVVGTNQELPDVPVAPTNFTANADSNGVTLTWTNANRAAVDATSIEYATSSGGPWTVLAQVGGTTEFFHHIYSGSTQYYYRARARGPLAQAGWSAYTVVLQGPLPGLDSVIDGNTFARTRSNTLLGGVTAWFGQTGKNACPNPSLESNLVGAVLGTGYTTVGKVLVDSWAIAQCDPCWQLFIDQQWPHGGANCLLIRLLANSSIPANTTYIAQAASAYMPIRSGDMISIGAYISWYQALALAAGLTVSIIFIAEFRDVNYVYLGGAHTGQPNPVAGINYTSESANYLVPALIGGVAPAFMRIVCYASITNSTGGALSTPNGLAADIRFDDLYTYIGDTTVPGAAKGYADFGDNTAGGHAGKHLGNMPDDDASSRYAVLAIDGNRRALVDASQAGHVGTWSLDSRVADGATYARIKGSELSNGVHKLMVAGSGAQPGDPRNIPGVTSAGVGYYLSGMGITQSGWTGSSYTLNVAAGSVLNGATSTAYNATSVSGVPPSTLCYLFYDDPGFAGGSPTLQFTSTKTVLSQGNNRIYVGSWTTGAGGGGGNPGGGGGCVTLPSWLDSPDGPLQAFDAEYGDRLHAVDNLERHHQATVLYNRLYPELQPCVRLKVDDAELELSEGTPVLTRRGLLPALAIGGEEIWTSEGWHPVTVERVRRMAIGSLLTIRPRWSRNYLDLLRLVLRHPFTRKQPVMRTSLGGLSFGAAARPGLYLYTHNMPKP